MITVGERALREIYLPAFQACVEEAGVWSVMAVQSGVNGSHGPENRHLLTEILKEEWGFRGIVVSDWKTVRSTEKSIAAGLDVEMPKQIRYGRKLIEGVAEGIIDVTRFDMEPLDDDTVRMEEVGHISAGRGQCGALIPPVEHHRIANPYKDLAITIHVYGGRMRQCRTFEDRGDKVYAIRIRDLSFSTPEAALSPA